MQYFNTLPKVQIIQPDGTSKIFTNLLSRVSLLENTLNNPLLYYSYDIQEGDTPEIIADKYYGDSYRYWMVLIANRVIDPQWDWPLTSQELLEYISSKYTEDPYSTIHHYEKIITNFDSASQNSTTKVIQIDEDTYNALENSVVDYTFNASSKVTITTTKRPVTLFQYETELNESKRNIKLIRKDFVKNLESNLRTLLM